MSAGKSDHLTIILSRELISASLFVVSDTAKIEFTSRLLKPAHRSEQAR